MTRPVISTTDLVKRYGSFTAVDRVSLDVREGDRYGFLGPNGSGKTTTVRMLLGLVLPTSGRIEVLGRPVPGARAEVLTQVGALIEGPAAIAHLSGRTNLRLYDGAGEGGSRRTRRDRVEQALERVGLSGVDERPVKQYSLGMRQRLGLAAALLHAPRLLILDEPTNGLDPRGISEVRELLVELNRGGTTVFLSSHLLAEIEALCTRVGVVDRGRLVAEDELEHLVAPTGRYDVHTPDVRAAAGLLGGAVAGIDRDRLLVAADDPVELNRRLVEHGVRVAGLGPERRTLEDVVLELTGASGDRQDAPRPAPARDADDPGERRDVPA